MKAWTTAGDLRERLHKEWERGRILAATLTGEPFFPWRLSLTHPSGSELTAHYGAVQDWINALTAREGPGQGGYTLEWREVNHRQLGRNRVPVAAVVTTEADGLRLLGKQRQAAQFCELASATRDAFPALLPWLIKKPLTALEHASRWQQLCAVLAWLLAHPRPGIYLRQLEIPGVDSKFIEGHKKLLAELLDLVLPAGQIYPTATGLTGFTQRYGFLDKPTRVRFRLLDPALFINGLSDLEIPAPDFARLTVPVERVFITENEVNGLAFPDCAQSMVIFGLGFGLDRLAPAHWLAAKKIHYWGDIDSHGFAMLDQIRQYFPKTSSFLMDRDTLLAHQPLWGTEPSPGNRQLSRLTPAELLMYEDLQKDRLAPTLRLEQERISFAWLKSRLQSTMGKDETQHSG